jgi:hypothetical protein
MKQIVCAMLIFLIVLQSLVLSDHILMSLVNRIDLPEKVVDNEGMKSFSDIQINDKENVRISIQTTTLVNIVVKVDEQIAVEQKRVNNFNYHSKNQNTLISVEGPASGKMYVLKKYDVNVMSYFTYFVVGLILMTLALKMIFI